ncbi:MAG: stage VI sporulation protein F [Anaeroplasma bactoclasticum]|nr:stage VI sporulation protein F [Prevotella sp.]MCM1514760.1 stage VI sporulation protein F [Anaeroplasma bactoclasticum]
MNLNKVMNFIAENNIQPEAVFALVEKVRYLDLTDEASIRQVIRDVSKLAGKNLDKAEENKLVRDIMSNGVNENIFNSFNN